MNFISAHIKFFIILFVSTLILAVVVSIFGSLSEGFIKDSSQRESLGRFFKGFYMLMTYVLAISATPLLATWITGCMVKIDSLYPTAMSSFFVKKRDIVVTIFSVGTWIIFLLGFIVIAAFEVFTHQ